MCKYDLKDINDEQKKAITTIEGPGLILSSSHVGNTFIIVKRAANLILQNGISEKEIMIGAFSERTVSEIKYGLAKELQAVNKEFNLEEMYIGRFDTICLKILTEYGQISDENIIDKIEQRTLILKNINVFTSIDGYELLFEKNTSIWKMADKLVSLINSIREEGLDIAKIINKSNKIKEVYGEIINIYNKLLRDSYLIDYVGIQLRILEMFNKHPEILAELIARIKYIILDEYNYSRYIQEEIIFMLGIDKENICVAGNINEKNYLSSGELVRNIREFPYKFTVNECKIFKVDFDNKSDKDFTYFKESSVYDDLNYILYGPPGTGKTYNTINYAVAFIENKDVETIKKEDYNIVKKRYNDYLDYGRIVFTTFHQSYGYEDFIEGIKPTLDSDELKYKLESGVFKNLCYIASKNESYNYVIIIDEINRGNISKIFGELITLIEKSKRMGTSEEIKTVLPYSKEDFSVPNNVFLLGTMNTADRSIALLDTALRRRFHFIEMLPDETIIKNINDNKEVYIDSVNINKMLIYMNKKIELLYDRHHTIGHAFFIELINNRTMHALESIFKYKIIPLLQEYFYSDYEKIRLVLGDNKTNDIDCQFIIKSQVTEELFGSDFEIEDYVDDSIYKINEKALTNPKSYIKIYNGNNEYEK